ncbi:LrgB family protein [Clostridium gasigenes]|uniref:TIGR00659 family protein n=1 Tax=Clostridium gasigenes TaxID=94869 RepID=A0A1H0VXG4_9CLOT|nr:LrgB family protein [Clostridium gasigenes]MBU3090232.1 LrgB family protein [Clostridium gasigenes]SDP83217.1 TIGR00659 family protein [Clostridium gasigenes]
MKEIINNPLFWILITLAAFEIGIVIYKRTKFPLFNPLLIAIVLVIGVLVIFNIDYEIYNLGGKFINNFLGPATVVLAVPLYKQLNALKKNLWPVLIGLFVGSLTSIVCVIILGKAFGLDESLIASLVPKSVTTPIGVEISNSLGGVKSITIVCIVLTGIVGAIIAPIVSKVLKIKSEVAIGIGIGAASHAVGTSKAFEMGEVQGAMSSLSIGIAGLITVFLSPSIYMLARIMLKF